MSEQREPHVWEKECVWVYIYICIYVYIYIYIYIYMCVCVCVCTSNKLVNFFTDTLSNGCTLSVCSCITSWNGSKFTCMLDSCYTNKNNIKSKHANNNNIWHTPHIYIELNKRNDVTTFFLWFKITTVVEITCFTYRNTLATVNTCDWTEVELLVKSIDW